MVVNRNGESQKKLLSDFLHVFFAHTPSLNKLHPFIFHVLITIAKNHFIRRYCVRLL